MARIKYAMPTNVKMMKNCDRMIAVWDGESEEVFINMLLLLALNKKCRLYHIPSGTCVEIEKIDDLNMNVTKLTTLLEAEQRHEEENDKKIELLQQELNETTQELKGLTSSISTLKWLVGLGVPILVVILTFLLNHFI